MNPKSSSPPSLDVPRPGLFLARRSDRSRRGFDAGTHHSLVDTTPKDLRDRPSRRASENLTHAATCFFFLSGDPYAWLCWERQE